MLEIMYQETQFDSKSWEKGKFLPTIHPFPGSATVLFVKLNGCFIYFFVETF
jgi:hypothetical protein